MFTNENGKYSISPDSCWHPQDYVQGKGKGLFQVHSSSLVPQTTDFHIFAHVVPSTWNTTLLAPILTLTFNFEHANYKGAFHQMC